MRKCHEYRITNGTRIGRATGRRHDGGGSYDVCFGPEAPADKGFFVVLRFYGPLEGYIDKTWVMSDFELVK
jgi:hypothetical protein